LLEQLQIYFAPADAACLRQEAGELAMNGKAGYPSTERKRPRGPSGSSPPRRSDSRSRSRSRSRDRGGGAYHHDRYSREDTRESNPGTVFVGNISHDTTENTLRDFFETYGRVASAKARRSPLCCE